MQRRLGARSGPRLLREGLAACESFAQQPTEPSRNHAMWKLAAGFVAFAALSLFVIFKAGGSVDMSGEKHGTEAHAPVAAEQPAEKK
jgi:hypothetical protein